MGFSTSWLVTKFLTVPVLGDDGVFVVVEDYRVLSAVDERVEIRTDELHLVPDPQQ